MMAKAVAISMLEMPRISAKRTKDTAQRSRTRSLCEDLRAAEMEAATKAAQRGAVFASANSNQDSQTVVTM
jgi:hypothetical protein